MRQELLVFVLEWDEAGDRIGVRTCVSAMTLLIRHSARVSVNTGILFTPLLWLAGLRGAVPWIGAAVGLVIAFRFLIDWNRKYRELWLDREKKTSKRDWFSSSFWTLNL